MTRWIGRDAVPALLNDVFGVEDRTQLKQGKASLPLLDNEYSERVRAGELTLLMIYTVRLLIQYSRREIKRPQVKGRGLDYSTYAVHYQGRRRPSPQAMDTDPPCRRPGRPG